MTLILYTGQDCCLCEQAQALIAQTDKQASAVLEKVDVKSSTELYHLYGARIPVLHRPDTNTELCWPFDSVQLQEFLV